MFMIWGIADPPTTYTPGSIRRQRRIQKVSPGAPVSAVMPHAFDSDIDNLAPHQPQKSYSPDQHTDSPSDRVPAVVAKQIMTAPVTTLGPETTIHEARKLFQEHRFRHVPIVEREQKIIGLLSDRDVLRYLAVSRERSQKKEGNPFHLAIRHIMAKEVLTAHPETEIRSIARVMFTERIGSMPIVDQNGILAGMITRSDILRTVMQHVPFELWI